jgi:hypothetical protein
MKTPQKMKGRHTDRVKTRQNLNILNSIPYKMVNHPRISSTRKNKRKQKEYAENLENAGMQNTLNECGTDNLRSLEGKTEVLERKGNLAEEMSKLTWETYYKQNEVMRSIQQKADSVYHNIIQKRNQLTHNLNYQPFQSQNKYEHANWLSERTNFNQSFVQDHLTHTQNRNNNQFHSQAKEHKLTKTKYFIPLW